MTKNKKLNKLLELLKEKKTEKLKVLDISKISIIADYFVIITMGSLRSVDSLDTEICEHMLKNGYEVHKKEGVHSKWVLIDFSDIVVHIFDNEYSSFYNLDKLWADAREIQIDN